MNRAGSVYLTIVGIVAVIAFVSSYFISMTLQEGHQVQRSHRMYQVECLAEAALERTLTIIKGQINDPDFINSDEYENSLAERIRRPYLKTANVMNSPLGNNHRLDVTPFGDEVTFTLADLEQYGDELTELVHYMTHTDSPFEVEVTLSIDRAYSNAAPGNHQVVGVDVEFNSHSGVKEFLDNMGFPALTLSIPETIRWLDFRIPLGFNAPIVGQVTVFELCIIGVLEMVLGAFTDGDTLLNRLIDMRSVHNLLVWVFDTLFPGQSFYPYEIELQADIFPEITDKVNHIVSDDALDSNVVFEKLGIIKLVSEASITYPDNQTVTRSIEGTKEFRSADIEPIAPMYSFFVVNNRNATIDLNAGGNLTVNNFAGYRTMLTGPNCDQKREFPGLVRLNGTSRMVANVGFIGNPLVASIDEEDNSLKKLVRPAQWLLMIGQQGWINVCGLRETVCYTTRGAPPTDSGNTTSAPAEPPPPGLSIGHGAASMKEAITDGFTRSLARGLRPNIMPPQMSRIGVSIVDFPFHFAREAAFSQGNQALAKMLPYPGGRWEWPFMGRGWQQYRIPVPVPSQTTTHFFGTAAAFPTMTREVEGYVLKRTRQWHLMVISWPMLPIPKGKQIPIPWPPKLLLPFPLPYWHTHDLTTKYGYNLWVLSAPVDNTGEIKEHCTVYDPSEPENQPPNLYTLEQYVKKAANFYWSAEEFYEDIPNRIVVENGVETFRLDGVTYIADNVQLPPPNEDGETPEEFIISGRGSIVSGGVVELNGSIRTAWSGNEEREEDTPRTVFSLIVPAGYIVLPEVQQRPYEVQGSIYTKYGLLSFPGANNGLKIVGNLVIDEFLRGAMRGETLIEYCAFKTRSSLSSIHHITGVHDPERYHVSFSSDWDSWRVR